MAFIKCTIQEYHHFIGPRIRNAINSLTRNARKDRDGVCEQCGNNGELDSAHVHGKGRRDIIEKVLTQFMVDELVVGDLEEIEQKILDEHLPINSVFIFLCKSCHNEYDSGVINLSSNVKDTKQLSSRIIASDPDFQKHILLLVRRYRECISAPVSDGVI